MKRFVKISFLLATMAVVLSSCNCYSGMAERMDLIKATSSPEVLALKGNVVPADIRVQFPPKYFNKKAVLRITPVLVCSDRTEFAGTPKYVQGEKVKDNYTVISKKNGGSYVQSISFPYDKRMKLSTLELRVEAKCASGPKKRREFTTIAVIAVAEGVSTVQLMADFTAYMTIMPDNFKRITTETQEADIMYAINKSDVRPAELTKDQVKLFEDFVKENANKDRVTLGNVYAKGYASPDGPVDFNDQLSRARSQSGQTAISKELTSINPTYDVAYYGEDWEGFKELVEASNMRDKALILQVLNMYSNPVKRDEEIHKMSSVFDVLKTDILPQLRRTRLIANADVQGRTDAELRSAVNSNINVLNEEELLFAATLFDDNDTKAKAYQAAASRYNSARGYNNYGVILAKQSKLTEAKAAFDRAATMSRDAAISNNLGVLALMNGDVAAAKSYISALSTADARNSQALITLQEGNYAQAARTLTGYNGAVAAVCNNDLARAKQLIANDNSAKADYLKAVIAMREGNSSAAISNLRSSIAKDPSLREAARQDVEFAKIFGTTEYLAL